MSTKLKPAVKCCRNVTSANSLSEEEDADEVLSVVVLKAVAVEALALDISRGAKLSTRTRINSSGPCTITRVDEFVRAEEFQNRCATSSDR